MVSLKTDTWTRSVIRTLPTSSIFSTLLPSVVPKNILHFRRRKNQSSVRSQGMSVISSWFRPRSGKRYRMPVTCSRTCSNHNINTSQYLLALHLPLQRLFLLSCSSVTAKLSLHNASIEQRNFCWSCWRNATPFTWYIGPISAKKYEGSPKESSTLAFDASSWISSRKIFY